MERYCRHPIVLSTPVATPPIVLSEAGVKAPAKQTFLIFCNIAMPLLLIPLGGGVYIKSLASLHLLYGYALIYDRKGLLSSLF